MTTQYEYSARQFLIPGFRNSWRMPFCDVPSGMRVLDERIVTKTSEIPWETLEDPRSRDLANDRVLLPAPFKPGALEGGRCMQRASSNITIPWDINDAYGPSFPALLPAAKTGAYWVEGNPRPLFIPPFWGMAWAKIYDKHIILVDESQSWEVIGATNFGKWRARGYGRFENNEIQEGNPVTWNRESSMASRMLNRGEWNHVISMVVRGSDHDPEHFPWNGQRLSLNLDRAPAPLNDEQERFLNQLANHGVSVDDHGGNTGLSVAQGGQWNDTTLHALDIRLHMFDAVISEK